jgi:hypothetical protein
MWMMISPLLLFFLEFTNAGTDPSVYPVSRPFDDYDKLQYNSRNYEGQYPIDGYSNPYGYQYQENPNLLRKRTKRVKARVSHKFPGGNDILEDGYELEEEEEEVDIVQAYSATFPTKVGVALSSGCV